MSNHSCPQEGIKLKKTGLLYPKNKAQSAFIKLLTEKIIVFAEGPAGTGKTWLGVAYRVALLEARIIERLIFARPALEVGEKIGFLPGDVQGKLDPFLRPIFDALHYFLDRSLLEQFVQNRTIEIAPLGLMRGRNLTHAFIVLDEAQNTTINQMKMFLTRLGRGSRMVLLGDLSQSDLPKATESGFSHAMMLLRHIPDIGQITFSASDIVRHSLVQQMINAYHAQR